MDNDFVTCPHCGQEFPLSEGHPHPSPTSNLTSGAAPGPSNLTSGATPAKQPYEHVLDAVELHRVPGGKAPATKVREYLAQQGITDAKSQNEAIEAAKAHVMGKAATTKATSPATTTASPATTTSPVTGTTTPTTATAPTTTTTSRKPHEHVLDAVQAHGGAVNLAPLHQIRGHLASQGIKDRAAQDAAIQEARKQRLVTGQGVEGRHGSSDVEREAFLHDHGEQIGFLSERVEHLSSGGTVGAGREEATPAPTTTRGHDETQALEPMSGLEPPLAVPEAQDKTQDTAKAGAVSPVDTQPAAVSPVDTPALEPMSGIESPLATQTQGSAPEAQDKTQDTAKAGAVSPVDTQPAAVSPVGTPALEPMSGLEPPVATQTQGSAPEAQDKTQDETQAWTPSQAEGLFVVELNAEIADTGYQLKDGKWVQTRHMAEGCEVQDQQPSQGVFSRIAGKVQATYAKLSKRYGPNWAKAIIGAGALGVPIPVPLASFLTAAPVLAAAEAHRYVTGGKQGEVAQDIPHMAQGGEAAQDIPHMAQGGEVAQDIPHMAQGGEVAQDSPGEPRGQDTVATWLQPGEEVIPAKEAQEFRPILKQIEHGQAPAPQDGVSYMAQGGTVGKDTQPEVTEKIGKEGKDLAESLEKITKAFEKLLPSLQVPGTPAKGGSAGAAEVAGAATGGISELLGPAIEVVSGITDTFAEIGHMISAIPQGISKAISAIPEGIGQAISAIPQGISKAISAIPEGIGQAISAIPQGISKAISAVPEGIGQAISAIPEGISKAISAVPEGISKAFSAISEGVGKAISAVFTGIVKSISGIADSIKPFVEALSPASAKAFDDALRGLNATIGVAFLPLLNVLTQLTRQVAGVLMPVVEALQPVFTRLGQVIGGIILSALKAFADALLAMQPVIDVIMALFELLAAVLKPVFTVLQNLFSILGAILAPFAILGDIIKIITTALEGWGEIFSVLSTIFRTLIQTVTSFIGALFGGTGIKSIIDGMVAAFKRAIEAILVFTAYVAKAFGADAFLKNLIQNLKPRQGAAAAAQGVSIKGFEQISKDVATASAAAAGAGQGNEKKDLSDVVSKLEEIEKGTDAGNNKVVETLGQIKNGVDAIATVLRAPNAVYEAIKDYTVGTTTITGQLPPEVIKRLQENQ